jgi:rhodanese-related sulfurtransferase
VSDLDLSPREVADRREEEGWALVDVRTAEERAETRIAGDRHIPLEELTERGPELADEGVVVFYCRVGNRSAMAAEAFRASGLEAHHLAGGIEGWEAEGLPVEGGLSAT